MNPNAHRPAGRILTPRTHRLTLAAVPLALAALLGAPAARAQTVLDVPCGQPITASSGSEVVLRLQACSYPSMNAAGFPLRVEGNGAVIDLAGGGFAQALGNQVTLRDLRVTNGTRGGLWLRSFDATLERVVIHGNRALYAEPAGGLWVNGGVLRQLTISDSTISDNSGWQGGGLWLQPDIDGATVSIVRSTISGNHAVARSGDSASGSGGGLYIFSSYGLLTLQLSHSTVSGNRADLWGGGMGVFGNFRGAIENSTITGNSAVYSGSAIEDQSGGPNNPYPGYFVRRSIIAGNGAGGPLECAFGFADFKQDYGYNVLSAGCVGAGAPEATTRVVTGSGALLGALADNGGPTKTHLPQAGSPALDLIPAGSTGCTSGSTDQRGVARPQNGACDAGAVEVAPVVAVWPFSGFFNPVDNLPMANTMKAGAAVPVKFSLGGDRGLDIFAAGYPQSQQVACGSAAADVVELTVVAAGSKLSYDAASASYTYAWKTDKAWRGSCRLLTLRLADGTDHAALFQFK